VTHGAANKTRNLGATMNHCGYSRSLDGSRSPLYVSGCAIFTSTAIFRELHGFDGRLFLFVEDVELCWRALTAGYDVSVVPSTNVFHAGGASAGGGYFSKGSRYNTSTMRVALRDRNFLTVVIGCAPRRWLWTVVPMLVAQTLALALASLALKRPALAKALVAGLLWNRREFANSLRRRHSLDASKLDFNAGPRRFTHRPIMLPMVLKTGTPQIQR
jgi:GT2 family glycosyltransferase